MSYPDMVELVLNRIQSINDEIGTLTADGQTRTLNTYKVVPVAHDAYQKLPLIYAEPQLARSVGLNEGTREVERDFIIRLILNPLSHERQDASGAIFMQGAFDAENVLLAKYLSRPYLENSSGSQLAYIPGNAPVEITSRVAAMARVETQEKTAYAAVELTLTVVFRFEI